MTSTVFTRRAARRGAAFAWLLGSLVAARIAGADPLPTKASDAIPSPGRALATPWIAT